MKVQTISVTLPAERDVVFKLLSNVERLCEWAPALCRRVTDDGVYRRALTPVGELYVLIQPDAGTGVIDLLLGDHLDEMSIFPLRIVNLPHGSAVILTYIQTAGTPNEIYDSLYRVLLSDMRGLMRRFGGGELHGDADARPGFFPSLVTAKFYETWDFYTAVLGFKTLRECDEYVQLSHPSGVQFGLHRHESDGFAPELVSSTDGRGFWLSIQVADADAEYERLEKLGVAGLETPEDRPWGERSFLLRDPNGVVLHISHRIATPIPLVEVSLANA